MGYGPRKWLENVKMMSFYDTAQTVYKGSRAFDFISGTQISGLKLIKTFWKLENTKNITTLLKLFIGVHAP